MRERTYLLIGWTLFIVSAGFFVAASWRAGDALALIGSLFFLVACFAFLIPILHDRN